MLDQVYAALADPTRRAILGVLAEGESNVGSLAERFPISLNGVSKHVKVLERAGLVERQVFAEIPPRVEYELTGLGKSLLDVMTLMGEWATRHEAEIQRARKAFRRSH